MTLVANGSRSRPFQALFAAAKAIEARLPDALSEAVESVPHTALLRVAARHRCLGYLYYGAAELGLRSSPALALKVALRPYVSKAALQSHFVRAQLGELMQTFARASLPCALLKGGARIITNDREADRSTMYDLDVLVPRECVLKAVETLHARGYRTNALDIPQHHHVAPLHPPQPGLPVELHVELAPPGWFSTKSDWQACQPYFEHCVSNGVNVSYLNRFGSALHLVLHGARIRRLHDVIMLSRMLRDDQTLHDRLLSVLQEEVREPISLRAVLALAARIAGIPMRASGSVNRYLDWVFKREDLTAYARDHCQFVDAWYANGGTLFGPSTRQAFPHELMNNRRSPLFVGLFVVHSVGRIATSAYAAAAAATLPEPSR